MAYRLYITPGVGDPTSEMGWQPKYFVGIDYAGMLYGFQNIWLVAANLTPEQDTAIIANSDVFAFPFNLNATLTAGQVNSARNALEAALIPAQSLSPQDTWLKAARMVAGMFQFMRRLQGIWGNQVVITDVSQLNVQFGSLPADLQAAIIATAQSFGYSTAGITSTTQVRAILKDMSDQWGDATFILGNFAF